MKLNRDEIRDRVIRALHELLGPEDVPDIDERTNPIKDLGNDSADGVDFACRLSEVFAFHVPDKLNPFVDDARHCPRSVGEIVELMLKLQPEEVSKHA